MKKFAYLMLLISLFSLGCIQSDKTNFECENIKTLLNRTQGNFEFNSNSTNGIRQYFEEIKEFRKGKGLEFEVIPYTTVSAIGQITLDTMPKPKGSGYNYDCRSHFRLYINQSDLTTNWIQGIDCNVENTNQRGGKIGLPELTKELQSFWRTNGFSEYKTDSTINKASEIINKPVPQDELAVIIYLGELSISKSDRVLKEICSSYISFVDEISDQIYAQSICSLSTKEVEVILESFPLRIGFRQQVPYTSISNSE